MQRGLQFAAVAGAIYTLAGLIITVVASGGTIGSAATVTLPTLPFWQVISTRTIEIVQKLQQSFQGPPQAAYDALVKYNRLLHDAITRAGGSIPADQIEAVFSQIETELMTAEEMALLHRWYLY